MKNKLKEHPFFKDLPEFFSDELVKIATLKKISVGDYLFRQSQKAESFFILLSGQINLEMHAPGQHSILIQSLSGGEILGWSWMLEPFEWTYDAHIMHDGEVIEINGRKLLNLCDSNSECGYKLMKKFSAMMIKRLKSARMQLLDLYGEKL